MPNPTDRTTHDGRTVDWLTHCALLEMELRLGYRLTITQGSFNTSVSASAGTHSGSGAVDLAPWDWANKVKVARAVGFAAWHRLPSQGPWGEHCHLVMTGNAGLSPAAKRQVTSYFNGHNGLANNGRDDSPRPSPLPTYKWPGSAAAVALEKKAAALLDKKPAPAPAPKPTPKPVVEKITTDLVDLSHYNTVTLAALQAAAKAGVLGFYHKATEGTTVKDATYSTRRGLNSKVGTRWGAYHFASLSSDGTAQAKFHLSVAKVNPGNLPPMLDLESSATAGKTRAQLTAFVGQFVAEVQRQLGCKPLIYLSQGIDLDDTFGCLLWVPRYSDAMVAPRVNRPWKDWTIWQYGDEKNGVPATVPGLGHVDRNTIRGDAKTVLAGLRVPEKNKPAPPPKPVPTPTPKPKPAIDPVPVDPTVLALSVVAANVKCNPEMPQADVVSDVAALKKLPTPGAFPVWFGSEIEIPRYTQAWTDGLNVLTLCSEGECPISLRAIQWDVIGSTVHTLHEGKLNVSPHRVLSVVRATPKKTFPNLKLAFLAKHMVSGGFSNNYPDTKAWRLEHWNTDYAKTQATALSLLADGYTVVVGGDFNRGTVPPFHATQVTVATAGVDHLYVIPAAGVTLTVLPARATVAGELKTDHPAIIGTFTLKETA